jgi:hypothetical protein
MAKAVAKVEEERVPTRLIDLIERAAFGPNANMDQAERMMAMHERMDMQLRKDKFDAKMALAEADMRPVAADATNPQTRSKYASYAALDRYLRPIYAEKHGFALSFNAPPGAPDGYQRVTCDVTNCGYTRQYQIDMPADGKGPKGNDVMTKTHATGSAVSYGMRYLLKMIFNIAVGEADDDGNAASGKVTKPAAPITAEQVKELTDLFAKVPAPAESAQITLQHWGAETLADLTPDQHAKTVAQLKKKLKQLGL